MIFFFIILTGIFHGAKMRYHHKYPATTFQISFIFSENPCLLGFFLAFIMILHMRVDRKDGRECRGKTPRKVPGVDLNLDLCSGCQLNTVSNTRTHQFTLYMFAVLVLILQPLYGLPALSFCWQWTPFTFNLWLEKGVRGSKQNNSQDRREVTSFNFTAAFIQFKTFNPPNSE